MLKKLKRWRESRQSTKNLAKEIRRVLQLLEDPGAAYPEQTLNDAELILLAAGVGYNILRGHCILKGALANQAAVMARVYEFPIGRDNLH